MVQFYFPDIFGLFFSESPIHHPPLAEKRPFDDISLLLFRPDPQPFFATASDGLAEAEARARPQRAARVRTKQPCQEKGLGGLGLTLREEKQ